MSIICVCLCICIHTYVGVTHSMICNGHVPHVCIRMTDCFYIILQVICLQEVDEDAFHSWFDPNLKSNGENIHSVPSVSDTTFISQSAIE